MYNPGRDVTDPADRNDAGLAIAFFTEASVSSLVLGIEHLQQHGLRLPPLTDG
jgi:hypothetical protein